MMLTLILCLFIPVEAYPTSYRLPAPGNDLIGRMQYVTARETDTLLDIARRFDLGYNEITAANPGVDPWLPGEGTPIVIPTWFILPKYPRRGVVINIAEMRLYYYPQARSGRPREVLTYPISVGRVGWPTPQGLYKVVEKIVDPAWTVPNAIFREHAANGEMLPRIVPPGPDNPLGRFAMLLNLSGYLIHGTNQPFGIGLRASHGCMRLYPEDVRRLFPRIVRGTPVRIVNQPYKVGRERDVLFLEAHQPFVETHDPDGVNLTPMVREVIAATTTGLATAAWERATEAAMLNRGIPVRLTGSFIARGTKATIP